MHLPAGRECRGSVRRSGRVDVEETNQPTGRGLMPCFVIFLWIVLTGCQTYADSTPRTVLEGDNKANYERVFGEPPPGDVSVVNSVVVAYSWRPGVVTSDDFEFELIVPAPWIEKWTKRFHMHRSADDFRVVDRKEKPARSWYAPKAIDAYDTFIDASSVGYVHMLVDRDDVDGRYRVFVSKH